MDKKRISVWNAKPGMVVAEDTYNGRNELIIPKDTVLVDVIISRLLSFGVKHMYVYKQQEESIIIKDIEEDTLEKFKGQQETLKESKEFKAFKQHFDKTVKNMNSFFQNLIDGDEDVHIMSFIDEVEKIMSQGHSTMHVLDMIQCMREYDDVTFVHCLSVSLICNVIGQWIEFPKEELKVLTMAGLLHDIGKLKIPRELIVKPGKLTGEEYEIVKKHTQFGYEVLKDQNIDNRIKITALMHHERCDGTGYPLRKTAGEIHTISKIVSIADVYDAMTADRPYRQGVCPFDVIKIFEKEGLSIYDPSILITFIKRTAQSYIHANVQLSDGQVGEVIMINPSALSRPLIRTKQKMIDLSREKNLKIEKIL